MTDHAHQNGLAPDLAFKFMHRIGNYHINSRCLAWSYTGLYILGGIIVLWFASLAITAAYNFISSLNGASVREIVELALFPVMIASTSGAIAFGVIGFLMAAIDLPNAITALSSPTGLLARFCKTYRSPNDYYGPVLPDSERFKAKIEAAIKSQSYVNPLKKNCASAAIALASLHILLAPSITTGLEAMGHVPLLIIALAIALPTYVLARLVERACNKSAIED
jgi:hypothetical protein